MITMWDAFNFAVAIGAGACIGWHGVLGMPSLLSKLIGYAALLTLRIMKLGR